MNFCKKSEIKCTRQQRKIKLTPRTQQDMENIYLYSLLKFNEAAADKYLSKLENAFSAIA
ncbi:MULTISPECIES: type II toxin-antitoxin system RelE/ParE family toxin [unclassified Brenneria]|uniref:type II toxin-antitoxin system RelE/ParE family toxin n=1 Tax=unclassified Brenneria TaxID=2634434 RepID=UPI002ECEFAC0|nr:type II toxin-antitoxin system RelE/ParE family toxin [Brenneria sp. HEZEL_4_2_4]